MPKSWKVPAWLVAGAADWWLRIVDELSERGLLGRSSRLTVGILAQLFHQYDVCTRELARTGLTVEVQGGSANYPTSKEDVAPAVEIQHNHITQMCKLIRELKLNSEPIGDEDTEAVAAIAQQLANRKDAT